MSSEYNRPAMNVPIPYGLSEVDKMIWGKARGIQKYFEDPDFIYLDLDREFKPGEYTLKWATALDALDAVRGLRDVIKQSSFKKARIGLRTPTRRPNFLMGGEVNCFNGSVEDILAEVEESSERVMFFELSNKALRLAWGQFIGVDFHDIPTNELQLHVKKPHVISRIEVDQSIALTGYPGLCANLDATLDEFSMYVPELHRVEDS